MKRKGLLLLIVGLALVPLITFVGLLVAGTVIPQGTFNAEEKLRMERHKQSQKQLSTEHGATAPKTAQSNPNYDATYITGINTAGQVRVNNLA